MWLRSLLISRAFSTVEKVPLQHPETVQVPLAPGNVSRGNRVARSRLTKQLPTGMVELLPAVQSPSEARRPGTPIEACQTWCHHLDLEVPHFRPQLSRHEEYINADHWSDQSRYAKKQILRVRTFAAVHIASHRLVLGATSPPRSSKRACCAERTSHSSFLPCWPHMLR